MENTELIVLRKTPYKETSLVISGISPGFGKLDFLIKGAKRVSKKRFPVVDLFREVQVGFNKHLDGLQSLYSVELLTSFDEIALHSDNFFAVGELSNFLLRNSLPMISSPQVYLALKNALRHYCQPVNIPWDVAVKLVYLSEHGLLPADDFDGDSQAKEELREQIILASIGNSSMPNLSVEYWEQLKNWVDSLCRYHELQS